MGGASLNAPLALGFVLTIGIVPSRWISRSWVTAAPLSAALALLLCGSGAMLSAIFGTPLLVAVIPVVLAANVVSAWALWRDKSRAPHDSILGAQPMVVTLVLGLVLFCFRPAPPGAWDARSIWWFHASWFEAGGHVVRDAINNPLLVFSHPDYPPADPAVVASLWRLIGSQNLYLAQAVTAVLTAMSLACLVTVCARRWRGDGAVTVVLALVVGASAHLAGGFGGNGYVDLLSASLLAGAFVALSDRTDRRMISVGVVLLAAGCLTKGEGLMFGLAGALIIAALRGRGERFYAALAGLVATLPAIAWIGFVWTVNPNVGGDVKPGDFVKLALLKDPQAQRFVLAHRTAQAAWSVVRSHHIAHWNYVNVCRRQCVRGWQLRCQLVAGDVARAGHDFAQTAIFSRARNVIS
jgi:hypothetical protein